MLKIPQGQNYERGTWKELDDEGVRRATFVCPDCGGLGTLYTHEIAEDGTVSPSVVCSYDNCSFHEYIQLEGWYESTS